MKLLLQAALVYSVRKLETVLLINFHFLFHFFAHKIKSLQKVYANIYFLITELKMHCYSEQLSYNIFKYKISMKEGGGNFKKIALIIYIYICVYFEINFLATLLILIYES